MVYLRLGGTTQHANYTRLYTDNDGVSHFQDLEVSLTPTDFAPPAAPLNVAPFLPAAQSLWVGVPAGWDGEAPHPAPQRQVFCTLQGEYEITAGDGSTRRFPVGSVLLL
ncbi:MAG: cupin domain-containing protein [Anaerolineae bacterium]